MFLIVDLSGYFGRVLVLVWVFRIFSRSYSSCAWCKALLLPFGLLVLESEHKVFPDVYSKGTRDSAREVSLADLCIGQLTTYSIFSLTTLILYFSDRSNNSLYSIVMYTRL